MNIDDPAYKYANTQGGGIIPPCTGLTPDALPEVQKPVSAENSHTGVSPRNAQSANKTTVIKKAKQTPHWYALRATYGREKNAYDYIVENGVTAFYPTRTTVKIIDGKRKTIEESYIPNILFAYGTKEELKKFARNKENEKCFRCNRLPVCMGLCPRDYMSGFSHCKYEVMDENFEVSLLDYLQHQLG